MKIRGGLVVVATRNHSVVLDPIPRIMTQAKEEPLPFFLNPNVEKLEETLGIPQGFLNRLVEEDDWSFVVKSHALIESALSYLLRSRTDQRAVDIYDSLPLHGAKASKIEFIKRLCPLHDTFYQFIREYSALRNTLLHDVRNVTFTFSKYFASLAPDKRRQVVCSFTDLLQIPRDRMSPLEREQIFLEHTREALVLSVMSIVSAVYFEVHPEEVERAWQSLGRSVTAFLLLLILALGKRAPPPDG
jgi:hypothetical protein